MHKRWLICGILAATCWATPARSWADPNALIRPPTFEPEPQPDTAPQPHLRTEWFNLNPLIYITSSGHLGGGAALRVGTLKWRHLFLTIAEGGVGSEASGDSLLAHIGTTVGYPIYLGSRHQHQIRLGAGLALGTLTSRDVNDRKEGSSGLYLLPTADYLFQFSGGFVLGGGVRLVFPLLVGDFSPFVMAFVLSVPIVGY